MRTVLGLLMLVVLSGCATSQENLPTERQVDLNKYAGSWYEQARLPNSFQDDCVGDVQADYALQSSGTINVTNQCRKEDGTTKVANAEGRLADRSGEQDPAKLEVRFAPKWISWLPMVWGDYWIIKLHDGYQYSLVGTPDRKYLWVLSREKQADKAVVQELLQYARTLGFPVDEVMQTQE